MEGDLLFPEGFHPIAQIMTPSCQRLAPYLRRKDVSSVKYYFTDFGISTRFENSQAPRLVTGHDGQDQDVPELSDDVPYDPFPVDIFTLGNLYKRHFIDVCRLLASDHRFLFTIVPPSSNTPTCHFWLLSCTP